MPVRAAVIARDYSVVSSGWLKNAGMRSRQRRNLLVSCTGLQGTGSFLLSCLVFDLEGYDALLGSDAVAYYRELCCMSFSAQDVCAQPMFESQSLPLEVCGGTTCGQQHLYVDYLAEHSIAGMCTSKYGPLCRSYVQACTHGNVRPPTFFLSLLNQTQCLSTFPMNALLPFWRFLSPTTPEQKRRNTIVALTNRLKLLQYLPFKRNYSYINTLFDNTFEHLQRAELLNVADAHGIPLTLQQHHIEDVKNINHVFQGLCADALYLPLSQIPVGCLDCLQEFVFADEIRKQTI
ncbi:hypothetical protein IW262DRAFT_1337662 [Armillaria fumosa]|nr:hypothetical protein IW262DRAFT_1421794 [Armillaria fumosa]KAK0230317.1 hypothetical protein IW262DRAFT_1337662 [Armillaria fumosa]